MSIQDEVLIGDRIAAGISLRRTSANTNEGWFNAEVAIQCDGFRGKFRANFEQGELSRFAAQLQVLYKKLKGVAVLAPLEPKLELSCTGDGRGHIEVKGTARAQFHTGTVLSFRFAIDQTYLPAIATGLTNMDPELSYLSGRR
jgi:hypothetical protein